MCVCVKMAFSVFHHLELSTVRFFVVVVACKQRIDFRFYCRLMRASCVCLNIFSGYKQSLKNKK